jgi:6-phosphogluconolactonase
MKMDTRIFTDIDKVSAAALAELLEIMDAAVQQRGRFAISLSGGRTPAKMYRLWADEDKQRPRTPWDRVHLFWGDERFVGYDDPLSNYRMTKEALIDCVPIPAENVHPMPTNMAHPVEAAAAYDAELRKFFGASEPAFELQLLGLGPEGHTASLFPGSPALEEKERWVVAVEVAAKPTRRLTLTLPVLNSARNTFFLVTGADKTQIITALRAEPDAPGSQYPAARVRPKGPVIWFQDEAAAS